MTAPTKSADFDRAYRAPLTFWGDVRVPEEVKALADASSVLELGCGVGRFSRYLAQQGVRATGVDFSPVAITEAKKRVAGDATPPDFQVGDVTKLEGLRGPYDAAFDVGCFHCLDARGQQAYVAEVARLLHRGGTHLIWSLDVPPSELTMTPESMAQCFGAHFELSRAVFSRRRLAASHWYWLSRK